MQKAQTLLASNWVWMIDVVFGGIIALAFEKLEQELRISLKKSRACFIRNVFCAGSFFGFMIYHISAFHIILHKFPYTISFWSAARFVLDLAMCFFLMMLLMRSVRSQAEEYACELLIGLTLWHSGAALWHVTASIEYEHALPPLFAYFPHFVFICAYWLLLVVMHRLSKGRTYREVAQTPRFIYALGILVICISIYRSLHIINKYGG